MCGIVGWAGREPVDPDEPVMRISPRPD